MTTRPQYRRHGRLLRLRRSSTAADRDQILDTIIEPAIHHMATDGNPFTGFLYAGLMMTADGPQVLEFNARLGDPETQALMLRLESRLVPALEAAATRRTESGRCSTGARPFRLRRPGGPGYPGNARTGDPITGWIEQVRRTAVVFQAGTKMRRTRI